jgi:TRAP-type mannitol/chloroaromatic compound transport system permease large subunit
MYKGVMPFIAVQIVALVIVGFFPEIATWLPDKLF